MLSTIGLKLKQVSKSVLVSLIVLASLASSLTLPAYTFKPKLDSNKIQELLKGLLSNSVQANAQDSSTNTTDPFALSGRYYNTDKPFSIFVSCVYSFVVNPNTASSSSTKSGKDSDKKDRDDDKKQPQTVNLAVFGYSNHTGKAITLDKSKLDQESKTWLNDTAKYKNFPNDIDFSSKVNDSKSDKKDNDDKNLQPLKTLNPGDTERAFAVEFKKDGEDKQNLPLQDISWNAGINSKNEASKYNTPNNLDGYQQTTVASYNYAPQCDSTGKSQFTSGFQTQPAIDPLSKVNFFVKCSLLDPVEVLPLTPSSSSSKGKADVERKDKKDKKNDDKDEAKNKLSTYSTILGYRNESGVRIDLSFSQVRVVGLDGQSDHEHYPDEQNSTDNWNIPTPSKENKDDKKDSSKSKQTTQAPVYKNLPLITQSYFQLSSQNLENLGVLKYQDYKNSTDQTKLAQYNDAVFNKDIDYQKTGAMEKLSNAIQYIYPGQDNEAMFVKANLSQEVIWTVKVSYQDQSGKPQTSTRKVSSFYKVNEPCNSNTGNSLPEFSKFKVDKDDRDEDDNNRGESRDPPREGWQTKSDGVFQNSVPSSTTNNSSNSKSSINSSNQAKPQTNSSVNSTSSLKPSTSSQTSSKNISTTTSTNILNNLQNLFTTGGNIQAFAETPNSLGGLDLVGYCQSKHGSQSSVVLTTGDIYGWKCGNVSIDTYDVCRWQYNDPNATAQASNGNDAYSWSCYSSNGSNLGGLDLNGYCQNKNGSDAKLIGSGAYNWVCKQAAIDLNDACVFQYGQGAAAYSPNQNDPVSVVCTTSGGNVNSPSGGNGGGASLPVDEDVEVADENLDDVATAYYGEQFAEINIKPDGPFILKLSGEIAYQAFVQYYEATKLPSFNECLKLGFGCAGKFAQAQFNKAKMQAYFIWGLAQGAGQSIVDLATLIKDLLTNPGQLTAMANAVGQLFQQPDLFANLLIDILQDYSRADIYGKYELAGKAVGQFIPDVIIAVLTDGAGAAASVSKKSSEILAQVTSKVKGLAKIANVAERFVNKAIYIGKELTIPIIRLGEKVGMAGLEVLNKLKTLAVDAFNRMMEVLPDWIKEPTEKIRNLFKGCGVVAFAQPLKPVPVNVASVLFGSIGVEAAEVCKVVQNRIQGMAGELEVLEKFAGASSHVRKAFQQGSEIFVRYIDVLTIDELAIEVKTGLARATSFIRKQVSKDVELLKRGLIKKLEWRFLKSDATGLRGPTKDLWNLLHDSNIPMTWEDGTEILLEQLTR
ncbi:MAG: hypothetical protein WCK98_03265 [bacterium]